MEKIYKHQHGVRARVNLSDLQKENVNFQVGLKVFRNTKWQRFMEQCLQSSKSFYDPRIPYPVKLIHIQEKADTKPDTYVGSCSGMSDSLQSHWL